MSAVPQELEETLSMLDSQSASALERLVRDAMALARSARRTGAVDANGWPVGYFEKTAGSLAGEPFDIPADPADAPLKTPRPKVGDIEGPPFEFPDSAFAPLTAEELKEWGL